MSNGITPLVSNPAVFGQFSKVWGALMSVNQANAQMANGITVVFLDMIGMLAWPATVSAFTARTSMVVTPTAAIAGDTPPAAVTLTLSGDGSANLPIYALN
jgi:hypothetical protein